MAVRGVAVVAMLITVGALTVEGGIAATSCPLTGLACLRAGC